MKRIRNNQVRLIINPDAFEKSFIRRKQTIGKEMETIMVQEVTTAERC